MSYSDYIALGFETTYGTDPGSYTRFYHLVGSFALGSDQQSNLDAVISSRAAIYALPGALKVSGDMEMFPEADHFGAILKATLGNVSTSQPDSVSYPDVYEHTFTPSRTIPSFTLIDTWTYPSGYRKFVGCGVDTLRLEAVAGRLVSARVSIIAAQESYVSSMTITPSFSSLKPMNFSDGTVKIDGSEVAKVESFRLEISNNIADDAFVIGSRTLPAIIVQALEISGDMDLRFDDWSLYQDFLNYTEKSIELIFKYYEVDATDYRAMTISLPTVIFDTSSIERSGADRVKQSISFKAYGGDSIITITLRNHSSEP